MIVSPDEASAIACPMLLHAVCADLQSLPSLPLLPLTYHVVAAFAVPANASTNSNAPPKLRMRFMVSGPLQRFLLNTRQRKLPSKALAGGNRLSQSLCRCDRGKGQALRHNSKWGGLRPGTVFVLGKRREARIQFGLAVRIFIRSRAPRRGTIRISRCGVSLLR